MAFRLRLPAIRRDLLIKIVLLWLLLLLGVWVRYFLQSKGGLHIQGGSLNDGSTRPIQPIVLGDGDLHSFPPLDETPKPDAAHLPDKIVVVGTMASEDTSWVERELPDWRHAIYSVDNISSALHTPVNKGKEAMPYLSYIIDNYDNLASVIAFVHAHRDGYPNAWHTDSPDHSNVASLQKLNLDFVRSNGYANLRCIHSPGCPSGMQLFRDPPGPADDPLTETEALMRTVWPQLFPKEDVPRSFAVACCAQFAVSRDRVLARPKADYVRWREWLMKTDLPDIKSGGIMEYLWHIVFGMEAEYCPDYLKCRCNVYGEC